MRGRAEAGPWPCREHPGSWPTHLQRPEHRLRGVPRREVRHLCGNHISTCVDAFHADLRDELDHRRSRRVRSRDRQVEEPQADLPAATTVENAGLPVVHKSAAGQDGDRRGDRRRGDSSPAYVLVWPHQAQADVGATRARALFCIRKLIEELEVSRCECGWEGGKSAQAERASDRGTLEMLPRRKYEYVRTVEPAEAMTETDSVRASTLLGHVCRSGGLFFRVSSAKLDPLPVVMV